MCFALVATINPKLGAHLLAKRQSLVRSSYKERKNTTKANLVKRNHQVSLHYMCMYSGKIEYQPGLEAIEIKVLRLGGPSS